MTSEGDADEVVCLFEGADDVEACGRNMKLQNSNMWKHLLDVHRVTKDDVRRRIAEQSKGGMRRYTTTLKRPACGATWPFV